MSKKEAALSTAFFADAPCEITYRDQAGRWTHRTIHIEELKRDHVLAKCEQRANAYRRFNLGRIITARKARPPRR